MAADPSSDRPSTRRSSRIRLGANFLQDFFRPSVAGCHHDERYPGGLPGDVASSGAGLGTIVGRRPPFVAARPSGTSRLRETSPVSVDGDVLDPVLHRLRADDGPSAAQWCRAPGAGSPVRATVVPGGLALETGGGALARLSASLLALPLHTRTVDRIAVPLVLPLVHDMDGLFAELRRVLAPRGLLSLLVPAPPAFGWRGRGLRQEVRTAWRHRSAVEHPGWLASSADFAVLADDRLDFRIPDPRADPGRTVADLCAAGVYPPDLPDDTRRRLAAHRSAARTVRLRRVVARR